MKSDVSLQAARTRGEANVQDRSRLRAGEFGGGDGAACRRCSRPTRRCSTTGCGPSSCARYERLIVSCVVKALRRYGATFSRDDLDDLVGDVWLVLLARRHEEAAPVRRGARLPHRFVPRARRHQRHHRSSARASGRGHAARRRHRRLRLACAPRRRATWSRSGKRRSWRARALAQLSGDERAFVVDCFRDERSPEELARALGVTTNTVYSRKFKIREKLQKIVRALDGAPVAA